ncbi:hypothetical protein [Streptomyces sp. x-80]|uniref:hypothetical protein n=1 Tax=Streptomyces sp. x-80 TaxID=2789282 RepID=UPI0039808A44
MALRTRSRLYRPTTAPLAALAACTLAIPLLSACGAVQKAADCANTAGAVVSAVDTLRQAAEHALDDPDEARRALDKIDTSLDEVSGPASDPDLSRAVKKMNDGIKNTRHAIENGKVPELTPLTDAAGEITTICTPG